MITYKWSTNKDRIDIMVNLALKNKLYVSGWQMQGQYEYPDHIYRCALAFDNNKPIGCCLYLPTHSYYDLMTFVKEKYRRRGIGTTLVRLATRGIDRNNMKFDSYSFRNKFFTQALGI